MNNRLYWEFAGGPVRQESLYIERKTDAQLRALLIEQYNMVFLIGSRQTGKTSMANRFRNMPGQEVRFPGWRMAYFDFRDLVFDCNERDKWFSHLFRELARQLNIPCKRAEVWFEKNRNTLSYANLVRDFVELFLRKICQIKEPLLFIFDELDKILAHGYYTDDFLVGLMEIAEAGNNLQTSILTVSILHPKFFFTDRKMSSLKPGILVEMEDFETDSKTLTQWGVPLQAPQENHLDIMQAIMYHTGGHSFLTSLLCDAFNISKSSTGSDVVHVVETFLMAQSKSSSRNAHFESPADFIKDRPAHAIKALQQYSRIFTSKTVSLDEVDEISLNILLISGLVKCVDNQVCLRNPIYERLFDSNWAKKVEVSVGAHESWVMPTRHQRTKFIGSQAKICLINTGGTIGMIERGNKMVPPEDSEEWISKYPMLSEIADIELIQLNSGPCDGANIFPTDWANIAEQIFKRRNDGYSGFVISHGTDTLAYSASAVAFALGAGLTFPVVFVGSQAPNTVLYGDAFANMNRAAKIATMEIPEVVVCYHDSVMRAVRTEKKDDYRFDGFHSPTYAPIATIAEEIIFNRQWQREREYSPNVEFQLRNEFSDRIIPIVQHPGLRPEYFEMIVDKVSALDSPNKVDAVIIQSLGVGNLPTRDPYSFLNIIRKLTDLQIPVLVTSRYPVLPEFAKKYSPASDILDAGALSTGNMMSATAYTKLSWLLPKISADIDRGLIKSKDKLVEIEKLMTHNFVGELDKLES